MFVNFRKLLNFQIATVKIKSKIVTIAQFERKVEHGKSQKKKASEEVSRTRLVSGSYVVEKARLQGLDSVLTNVDAI